MIIPLSLLNALTVSVLLISNLLSSLLKPCNSRKGLILFKSKIGLISNSSIE